MLDNLIKELKLVKDIEIDDVPIELAALNLGYYRVSFDGPSYSSPFKVYITDFDLSGYQLELPVDDKKPELGLRKIHDLKVGYQVRLFRVWEYNGATVAQQILLPLTEDVKLFKQLIENAIARWDEDLV